MSGATFMKLGRAPATSATTYGGPEMFIEY
jgi:hypothetical protein